MLIATTKIQSSMWLDIRPARTPTLLEVPPTTKLMPAPDIGSGGQPNLWYDIVPGSSTEVGDFLWEEGLNSDNSWPRGTRMILMYQTFVSVIRIALRPTRSLTCALNLCAPIAEMNRHLSDINLSEYGQFGATIIEDLCSLRFQNWGAWWDLMYLVSITLTRNYKYGFLPVSRLRCLLSFVMNTTHNCCSIKLL